MNHHEKEEIEEATLIGAATVIGFVTIVALLIEVYSRFFGGGA